MNVFDIAQRVGIQFDSFGVPVVDKKSMIEAFAKEIFLASSNGLDKKSKAIVVANAKLLGVEL